MQDLFVHSPTLLILLAILLGIMFLAQLASWLLGRRVSAQLYWAGAYLAAFLTAVNFLTRDYQPELARIVGAQLSQYLTAYLMLMGARSHMGLRTWPLRYGILGAAALLVLVAFFTWTVPQPAWRIALSSLVTGSLFALCAMTVAVGEPRRFPARYIFALICGIHAAFVLLRIVLLLRNGTPPDDLVRGDTIPPALILEAIISLVMIAFASLMLVSENMTRELRGLAERDPLTGCFNRRAFLLLFDKALSAAGRSRLPLSVLLIDLDHFKKINDTYGHRAGDEALNRFVSVAQACLRNEDVLGRIGGEEFAAFLPGAALADACSIAERLRCSVAEHASDGLAFTVSIGIAQCAPGEAVEGALHRADEAMYRAKALGRNRIEVRGLVETPPLAL